ncbi:hypothetical protein [Thermacetogenium phaeum]|nr:hypothetical protein [Thermacetogenium phaeum]
MQEQIGLLMIGFSQQFFHNIRTSFAQFLRFLRNGNYFSPGRP